MTGKDLVPTFLIFGIIVICSGCIGHTSVHLSEQPNVMDNSLSSIWEEIVEGSGLDRDTVHITGLNLRTDSNGGISDLQLMFSGI